jgi:hypothetical protein
MYIRKRIGRRRSFFRKHRVLIFFLVCTATSLLGFVLKQSAMSPVWTIPYAGMEKTDTPNSQESLRTVAYERTVYPYSVIPGGIRSRAELVSHIVHDPIVAAHYANFEIDQARFLRSEETQFVHVAYRLRNKIFWTAKTVAIPKGETLVTDGRSIARTRCGNKVSVLPLEPISAEEPPVETFNLPVFETPMIPRIESPKLDLSKQPEVDLEIRPTQHSIPYVPIQPPVFANLRYSTLRPLALFPQFNEVPEPGTIGLTIVGLIAFIAASFTRKK